MIKKNYVLVDFAKFICSLLVVAIHTLPTNTYLGYLISITSRIAVPFFFITSGYFLSTKLYQDNPIFKKNSISHYLRKIASLYISWSLLYLFVRLITYTEPITLYNLVLLIRDFLFIGVWGHLWYLPALCVCVYLSYIFIKCNVKFRYLLLIGLASYLFALSGDTYYGLFSNTIWGNIINVYTTLFGEVWNSYLPGLIFFIAGIGIKRYDLVHKINKPLLFAGIVYVLYLCEHLLLKILDIPKDNNTALCLILLLPLIFISLIKFDSPFKWLQTHQRFYRQASLTIYLIHPLIILIISNLFNLLPITHLHYIAYIKFIVVTIISIGLAVLAYKYKLPMKINKKNLLKSTQAITRL